MYISSDFFNKNAHKFFNSNIEKNDFGGINRVRFMADAIGASNRASVYSRPAQQQAPQQAQEQQAPSKASTDSLTTVVRSPADLMALTKGRNTLLPPDVYAALARGEEVQVTLSQRPPERVNLLVPVFAAFAQMAGSSGAAYNAELGSAIQGIDRNGNMTKGTGLASAADFVSRYGGDYGLNPFGGATHIDIDAQYKILEKKPDPIKVAIPPIKYPEQVHVKTSKVNPVDGSVTPPSADVGDLPNISTGTIHFDTKNKPKFQKDFNDFITKNPPPSISELKASLGAINFSEIVLDPKTKANLDTYISSQQDKLGLPPDVFNPKTGKVDLSKVPAGKEDVARDFLDVAVDAHEIGTRSQVDSTKDGRKAEYTHTLLGGDEYLVPFAKDLSKQGIDISSLRGKTGQIDQEKVMALVDSLNGKASSDPKINELSASIKAKPELTVTVHDEKLSVSAGAGKVGKDFEDLGLGKTEEQFAMDFLASSTSLGKLTYNKDSKTFTDSNGNSYSMAKLKTQFPELSIKPFGNTFATSIVVTPNNIPTLPNTSGMSSDDRFNAQDEFIQSVMGLGDAQTQSNLGPARITPQEYQDAKAKGPDSNEWKGLVKKTKNNSDTIKFAAEDYTLRMGVSSGKINNNDYLAASAAHIKNKNSTQWKDLVNKADTSSFSPAARTGITNYLNTCLQHGVLTSTDLSKAGVSDIKSATPEQLRKLFKTAENQLGKEGLGVGGTGSDGLLGSHHITALQMHIIKEARSISGGANAALKAYKGSDLSIQETQSLDSLVSSYNKSHPNDQITSTKPLPKDSLVKLAQHSSDELSKIKSSVTDSTYGQHPELKQMSNEIDSFVSAVKSLPDKLNAKPVSDSTDSISQPVSDLSKKAADLSDGIAVLGKLYSGEVPLSPEDQDTLRKIDNPAGTVDKILKDPFDPKSRTASAGMLNKASEQLSKISEDLTAIGNKPETSQKDKDAIKSLVSQIATVQNKDGADNDALELGVLIQKGDVQYQAAASNSFTSIENRIDDMKSGKINIESTIDVGGKLVPAPEYLKKLETEFLGMLQKIDPAVLNQPDFQARIKNINASFGELNKVAGSSVAADISSVMTDINNAQTLINAKKTDSVKPKGTDGEIELLTKSPNQSISDLATKMKSLVDSKPNVSREAVSSMLDQLAALPKDVSRGLFDLADTILARIKSENPALKNIDVSPSKIYSDALKVAEQTKGNFDTILNDSIKTAKASMFPKPVEQPTLVGTPADIRRDARTTTVKVP